MPLSQSVAFSKSYASAAQVITTAGALTLAHGLGGRPSLVITSLQCQVADANYAPGDVVVVPVMDIDGGNRGVSIVADATNINCRFGSAAGVFSVLDKSSGAPVVITNANWRLIVEAFK